MLSFLREKAKFIGLGIILFFVVTMSAGSLFLKNAVSSNSAKTQPQGDAVGMIGELPVDGGKYSELISQASAEFQQQHIKHLDPEMAEMVSYSCFNQAAQYTILKESAKASKIKVSSEEKDQALEGIYRQYDLKDKKQLKALLKKNNLPFDQFMDNIELDLKIQKFAESLKNQVTVTEQDVKNKYTQVHVQHILLITQSAKSGSDEEVLKKIEGIEASIRKGLDFGQAAATYSEDSKTKDKKGDLGWLVYGKTLKEFEDVAFALDKDEVSKPIKTAMGYHIIKVLDKKTSLPPNLDLNKEKGVVLQEKQNRAIQNYIQAFLIKAPLKMMDPSLKAYHAKISGHITEAINAYQGQISVNPANPVPHYLLAKIYLLTQENALAKQELEKGDLKADMSPQYDFPSLHIALGKIYKAENRDKDKQVQFTKAIAIANGDAFTLKQLASTFKTLGESSFEAEATKSTQKIEAIPVQHVK